MMDALDVASYILYRCSEECVSVSNTKLQKLLYFVFGSYYRNTGEELFAEAFFAYPRGPVVESVYNSYRGFAGAPIYEISVPEISGNIKSIVDSIVSEYGNKPVEDLIIESHVAGGAWDRTAKDNPGPYPVDCYPEISRAYIYAEFSRR